MDHLAARGITCPKPIHGRDGNAVRTLAGRPAAITTFLHGLWPRRIAVKHCAPLGRALAELHLAGRDFRAEAAQRAVGRRLAAAVRRQPRPCRRRRPGLARELGGRDRFFEANWPKDLPAGRHPCRSVPRQRLLPGRPAVGPDRLLLRLQRRAGLRRRDLPQRLVLRARPVLQRHQGARRCCRPMTRSGRSATPSARRCRCWRAVRRCASC